MDALLECSNVCAYVAPSTCCPIGPNWHSSVSLPPVRWLRTKCLHCYVPPCHVKRNEAEANILQSVCSIFGFSKHHSGPVGSLEAGWQAFCQCLSGQAGRHTLIVAIVFTCWCIFLWCSQILQQEPNDEDMSRWSLVGALALSWLPICDELMLKTIIFHFHRVLSKVF